MISEPVPAQTLQRQYSASYLDLYPEVEFATSTSTQLHLQEHRITGIPRENVLNNADLSGTQNQDECWNTRENPSRRRHHCWPKFEANPRVLRALCFTLHIGLVLLHCILLGIYVPHWEYRKVIPLGFQSTVWSIGVPALSQAFVTVYSTGILVLTQQLSLRRNLLVRQTLTATHDKSMAWNGLGSSLLTLWRQVSVTASVWGVNLITLYLAGISVLHISTPVLLTLQAFNNTIQTNISTTLALPSPPSFDDTFVQAAPILPLIGQYSQLSTIGLHGNTIYDVLPENQGIGNVTVNSTTFDVCCDILRKPHAQERKYGIWNINDDLVPHVISDMLIVSNFTISDPTSNIVRLMLPQGAQYASNRALYYSSVNFTDSKGGDGSWVTLNPPVRLGVNAKISNLQVMACRFFSYEGMMTVDAQTKTPVDPPQQKTSSMWGKPQPETYFSENSTELKSIMDWSGILYKASMVNAAQTPAQYTTSTVLDQFVAQKLGIKPGTIPISEGNNPLPHLKLYQLENALASLTSALHWSVTQLNPDNSNELMPFNVAMVGQATVSQPQLASRLKLNVVPISVGLGASVVLLVVAVILVGNLEGEADAVDSTGILNIIWLLRDRPDIQKQICQVETPSADELRSAGMFSVRLAGERRFVDRETSYQLCEAEDR